MATARFPSMLASVADRDRSVTVVKTSFVEGRLTKDELDQRIGKVLVSRYFEELLALTADLPVGPHGRLPAHPVTPPFPRSNRLAVTALICAGLIALVVAVAALAGA